MNAVWNSYGQLCGCPEIFKKSCKFFCRELDIRVKKLMNHYGGKSAMPYVGAPKDFDRIAKKFHVDYAFHKVSPGHYLLFFKANQADAITAAFQKYSAKVLNKEQDKASILGQLRKFTEQIRTQAKEKQRTREAVKDGR